MANGAPEPRPNLAEISPHDTLNTIREAKNLIDRMIQSGNPKLLGEIAEYQAALLAFEKRFKGDILRLQKIAAREKNLARIAEQKVKIRARIREIQADENLKKLDKMIQIRDLRRDMSNL